MRAVELKKGDRFGKWTVLDVATSSGKGSKHLCRCDCGRSRSVLVSSLRSGKSKSCGGCGRNGWAEPKKGQRFACWTVVDRSDEKIDNRLWYVCRCDCGAVRRVKPYDLHSGKSKSCGCRRLKIRNGERFGLLTVVEEVKTEGGGFRKWLCSCECGATKICYGHRLKSKRISSCGCNGAKGVVTDGKHLGAAQLAKLSGICQQTISGRLRQCQKAPTIDEILRPVVDPPKLVINGRRLCAAQIAALFGFNASTITFRLRKCQGEPTIKEILKPLAEYNRRQPNRGKG